MKLEGSLDAFSLPDIFQLLSYTKKTGGLRLQHAGGRGVVYFTDGAVTGASAEGGRQSLARRLIGMGLIEDAAITAAVDEAAAEGSSVGVVSALVAAGVVTADAASRIAFEQLHDAVFELLRWPSGDFQFDVDQPNPDDVGLRLVVEDVVKRASENTARWQAAAALVPSPDIVPMLAGAEDPTEIGPADWPVLRLIDGHRSVADIVELAGTGQLATVVVVADLIERGLVQARGSETADPVADLTRRFGLLAAIESDPPVPAVATGPATASTPEPEPVAAPLVAVHSEVAAVEESVAEPDPEPTAEPEPAVASTVVTVAEPAAARPAAQPADDDSALADLAPGEDTATPVEHETVVVPRPRLGGAHQPGDVVPPRAEPFLASRRPEFAESAPPSVQRGGAAATVGSAAVAAVPDGLIERDPSVNRSLLLRLIAGVRGL